MELLYVNACPRGEVSRTRRLAEALLARLKTALPDLTVTVHDLPSMGLRDVSAARLAEKEDLCDAHAWEDSSLRAGRELQRADAVLIAAPYWDLSFPSVLKVWVENIWVRNLTFVYRDDRPVGLVSGRAAVYLTTAGSRTAGHDWGTLYIEDVLRTLGIPEFLAVKAEALDLAGSDTEKIMGRGLADAVRAADWLAARLRA
ncbi:MAG: NAD(P)H-dependent oxidoreductase [Clostridia bacterium]|nr:NAD(P)H-dependent oxidoreductase [Clostridia bacterium]